MLSAERDHNRIVRRGGLELEIERSTKTFSQREAPSAIDSIAKWRMQNQLHASGFIEEPFHHQRLLRWNRAESAISIGEIIRDLLRSFARQFQLTREPLRDVFAFAQHFLDLDPQFGDSGR